MDTKSPLTKPATPLHATQSCLLQTLSYTHPPSPHLCNHQPHECQTYSRIQFWIYLLPQVSLLSSRQVLKPPGLLLLYLSRDVCDTP